ncbi:MAG TPA: GlsB/YeaQ/YmgE family stress response membrane protein [Chloroflexota bacterium]|nr:GlsB/YeaQ/YmgE family stress response membrane protein [Chloroflexota bacterium]
MSILAWIVLGLLAGWIASMIMGRGGYGVVGDIIVGILGALIGGFITGPLFGIDVSGFNVTSLLVAVIGAIVLIAILRAVTGSRRPV